MRKILYISAILVIVAVQAHRKAEALDANDVIKAVAIGTAVRKFSPELDKFVNTLMINHKMPPGSETKVVPMMSIGEKSYIGGVQLSGSGSLVKKVEAILQYEAAFDSGKYRLRVLFPTEDTNLFKYKSVQGVGISAVIDVAISGGAYKLTSGGIDTGDALRAVAIGAAVTQVADPLNSFINRLRGWADANSGYSTRVVPCLSFGERAYIGGVQVAGPKSEISRVKAVWQIEGLFESGKFRVKALVPTDSINPLKMSRVKGVGITALIDTTVATSVEVADNKRNTAPARGGDRTSANTGDTMAADDAINRAHSYIKASKDKIDAAKKNGGKQTKGKKGKHHKDGGPPDHAQANKRLADARQTLAKAREARGKGNYSEAVRLANLSMYIADDAVDIMY